MSRIGRQKITIPTGVTLQITEDNAQVTGPKGVQDVVVSAGIVVTQEDGMVVISRTNEEKVTRSAHGLVRAMIANAITGVTEGFKKQLEVNGVGFKSQVQGKNLKLSLGFSHDVNFSLPDDVSVKADKNVITIEGINRQRVGQIAADIRELKKPEPYKGKGIKYVDEHIVRKAGKTAGSGE